MPGICVRAVEDLCHGNHADASLNSTSCFNSHQCGVVLTAQPTQLQLGGKETSSRLCDTAAYLRMPDVDRSCVNVLAIAESGLSFTQSLDLLGALQPLQLVLQAHIPAAPEVSIAAPLPLHHADEHLEVLLKQWLRCGPA